MPATSTQRERILAVLSDGCWHGLPDFGSDAYTARNRIGELRETYIIDGRRAAGARWWEYRLCRDAQMGMRLPPVPVVEL